MKGSYKVKVSDRNNSFEFTLKRNITILRGDSGTGKTTLFEMLDAYYRDGKKSGVSLSCKVDIVTIRKTKNWEDAICGIKKSIIVIDEDRGFITSEDFAKTIEKSDNYYLLITRDYLKQLPYSVNEIYEVYGTKNKKFVSEYENNNYVYNEISNYKPDIIILEDSNAGFSFFNTIKDKKIKCISAFGKSNIINEVKKYKNEKILVIADGAAFGNEIEGLRILSNSKWYNIVMYLPESFEWFILKSGIIQRKEIKELRNTEDYVESEKFFSWERFFNGLLVEKTKDSVYCKYNKKKKLPKFYFSDENVMAMLNLIKKITIH